MMLLLLSMSSWLKNKLNRMPLTPNITLMLLLVKEKSPLQQPKETLTPLLRFNVKKPSLTPKVSSLTPRLNWLPLLNKSPSLSKLLKTVPPSELNKLLTTLSVKLNIKKLSTLLLMPSESLAIYKEEEAGSNLKVKLKKSLKKLNL